MPLVFVHGTNVRDTDRGYDANVCLRNEYFCAFILGPSAGPASIANPYWGAHGVTFRWGLASLPGERDETFGIGTWRAREILDVVAPGVTADVNGNILLPIARRYSVGAAIDALWAATAFSGDPSIVPEALVAAARRAGHWANGARRQTEAWLAQLPSDDRFIGELLAAPGPQAGGETVETFGNGAFASLGSGLSTLLRSVTLQAAALVRPSLNAALTRFLGDVLHYIHTRGERGAEGPIVNVVADALRAADRARSAGDEQLLVVAHSMGGTIAYDILTHFAPEVRCDVFVTVGAQVSLFEEMKLFCASDPAIPSAAVAAVSKPQNIGRWLNVYDPTDVLAYRAKPVFAGVEDFDFVSSPSPLSAHQYYFYRPQFFQRLSERLSQAPA